MNGEAYMKIADSFERKKEVQIFRQPCLSFKTEQSKER